MNRLQALLNREYGLIKSLDYDFALSRLRVAKEDSWRGIVPSNYSYDFNPEPPIFAAKFANCDNYRNILAIANEDGKIALQDTNRRNEAMEEQALVAPQCHYNAVFDLEWAPGQMKFVSASGDHTVRLWQVVDGGLRDLSTFVGHTRSVKTAAFRRNDCSVFATGGRDGAIIIWDTRAKLNMNLTPRAENCIFSGHMGGPNTPQSQRKRSRIPKLNANTPASSSITGLAFQDENILISCGAGDGVIKVWDLRRNYTVFKKEPQPKHSLPYAGSSTFRGFTNLIADAAGARLYANCMDNNIYCYNISSYAPKPLACYKGLLNSTFYIKSCLSPDGKYLLSGSSDVNAYIWNLNYAEEPLVALSGHTVEVTCVAWGSTYDFPIVTCSDEARHKIWRIAPESISENEAQQYCGHTVNMRKIKPAVRGQKSFLDLVSTPRTLKRWVKENELTPVGMTNKRLFASEMTDTPAEDLTSDNSCLQAKQPDAKRPRLLESCGRRLFNSISTNTPNASSSINCSNSAAKQDYFQVEDDTENNTNPCVRSCNSLTINNKSQNECTTDKVDTNLNNCRASNSAVSAIFSPTSNLPNYVMSGEAPHMAVMSPKRQVKQQMDWLTKIRKQKLMSSRRNGVPLTRKLNMEGTEAIANQLEECELNRTTKSLLNSPRLQEVHATAGSTRIIASPRRRSSQDGTRIQARTPTSSRRNCENTLLKFFSVQAQNSRIVEETSNPAPEASLVTEQNTDVHSYIHSPSLSSSTNDT